MGKRDLEKLRREHKEKFSRTKISSTRNFKAEQALTSNPNLKEETKSIPESNFKEVTKTLDKQNVKNSNIQIYRTESRKLGVSKIKSKSPLFRVVTAVVITVLCVGLIVLVGNRTSFHREKQLIREEPKYSSPNAKALEWEKIDFVNYKIEEIEYKNITVSDFVKRYGLAQRSEEMMVEKDKLLSLTYTLAGGGFALFQFGDFGSGMRLISVNYFTDQKEDLSEEKLSFLKELKPDSEKGISDQEVLEHLGLPNSYYKLGVKGYYSASMEYGILDRTYYHLEFAEGKDGRLHLKNIKTYE